MGRLRAFNDNEKGIEDADKYVNDDFSITMDFLMYLENMILAKLDDSYRHRSKRVKRTTLEDRMKSKNITSAL